MNATDAPAPETVGVQKVSRRRRTIYYQKVLAILPRQILEQFALDAAIDRPWLVGGPA